LYGHCFPCSEEEANHVKEIAQFCDLDPEDFEYLCDSGTEFGGLKIYGSPWTPEFFQWAFMKKRGPELKAVWDKIPDDVDILITHGPPYGILDKVDLSSRGDEFKHAGCEDLLRRLEDIKPKLHVFGHIHSDGGKQLIYKRPGHGSENNTLCVNASIMDEDYNPVNRPVDIEL
jgi:Icc-related predicted phosphoesterase